MNKATTLGLAMALPAFGAIAAPAVEVHGLLEVDSFMESDYAGGSTTDVVLATMELGFDATINSMVGAHVLFLYEEDATDPPALDEGYINMSMGRGSSLSAGKLYVPFGSYETAMLSDPMTLVMGETSESALMYGSDSNGLAASFYAFNGDAERAAATNDDTLSYGVHFGLAQEGRFAVGVGYISNLADSNIMQELDGGGLGTPGMVDAEVAGANAYLNWNAGSFSLIAEHVSAQSSFVAGDFNGLLAAEAKPSTNHLELVFAGGRGSTLALSYQTSSEAVFMGLPETAMGIAISSEVMNGATVGLEYLTMDDYAVVDGGTGESADLTTLRFAAEF